ncbi:hypothetical protein Gohar_014942 [Gossypium harknessii]|uniref:Uncharacterized protein n=1 Tax=Gossypium harknessii TaxID=34285 RepID=A0A7J9FYQ5_9ROSI|nr:hypothetical protein [Gossypium harknessii]
MQIPCEACLISDNQLVLIDVVFGLSGPSFVVGLPGCSYTPTVCIITMHGQTCQASCKLRSSLGTWPAFAMASSSCSGLSASVHLCSLFDTFTVLSSVSRKLDGLPCSQEVSILLLYQNQLIGDCTPTYSQGVYGMLTLDRARQAKYYSGDNTVNCLGFDWLPKRMTL